jgi:hypothetical protein
MVPKSGAHRKCRGPLPPAGSGLPPAGPSWIFGGLPGGLPPTHPSRIPHVPSHPHASTAPGGDGLPSTPHPDPEEWYRTREAGARASARELEGRSRRLSTARAVAFVVGVGTLLLLETSPRGIWPALLGVAAVGLGAFVVLMVRHRRVRRLLRRAEIRAALAAEGSARLRREWDRLPLPDLGPVPANHPWADDLDMVGRASVAHLLGTVSTGPGRAALRQALLDPLAPPPEDPVPWLQELDPRPPGEPDDDGPWKGFRRPSPGWEARRRARSGAVVELAEHPRFLEEIRLLGREAGGRRVPGSLEPFLAWARGPEWSRHRRWALPMARVLAVLNPTLLVLWFAGVVALPWWILGVLVALGVHRAVEGEAARRFDAAEAAEASVGRWAAILEAAARIPGRHPALEALRIELSRPGGLPPHQALIRLRRISDWAGIRRSSLAHFPLVALFCWDLHLLDRIEAWRAREGARVDGWVRTLGEVELLVALATLRSTTRTGRFPRSRGRRGSPAMVGGGIRATALRHPLLAPVHGGPQRPGGPGSRAPPPGHRVQHVGEEHPSPGVGHEPGPGPGRRAGGGGVLLTHPALPWTSMRIRDSLSQGVSFFLAELRRLHQVVEAARRTRPRPPGRDPPGDEHGGTARGRPDHPPSSPPARAVGAVSTHDLTLARAPDLEDRLVEIHLREEVRETDGQRTLHFDHRVREGPATSRNALILLEMVGLGADPRDPSEAPEDGPQP